MSAPALPPGAERICRFGELIRDVDEAVADLAHALPQVNDPDLRPRIEAFTEGARGTLEVEREAPGPEAADRLNELLNGVRELRIPARDPDLGGTPTLKALEQATGVIAIRLINALEVAEAMGWKPRTPELPERMIADVARDEAGTLLDRIADRLDRVNASLDQLVSASANAPRHQQGLVNFYVGSVRVELNLARMELRVGETRVDLAALWRAAEATGDLTADLLATLHAWASRVPEPVMRAAVVVRQRVRKTVTGVATTFRFVGRRRRRAAPAEELWTKVEAGEITDLGDLSEGIEAIDDMGLLSEGVEATHDMDDLSDGSLTGFDFEARARDMILEGRAPPAEWRPSIHRLDFKGTNLDRLDLLSPLTQLQWLDAGGTQIADLAPLAGLRRLQTLWLNYTQVADLAPLAGLGGLQTLYLAGTQVADLAPLSGLRRLQTLYLGGTQIADLAPLAGLGGLQTLSLTGTPIADLVPLAGLRGATGALSGRRAGGNLAPLAGLRGLRTSISPARQSPIWRRSPGWAGCKPSRSPARQSPIWRRSPGCAGCKASISPARKSPIWRRFPGCAGCKPSISPARKSPIWRRFPGCAGCKPSISTARQSPIWRRSPG